VGLFRVLDLDAFGDGVDEETGDVILGLRLLCAVSVREAIIVARVVGLAATNITTSASWRERRPA
jgi:hypothetical protein